MSGPRNRLVKRRSVSLGRETIEIVYPRGLESMINASFGAVRRSRTRPKRRVTVSTAKNQRFNLAGGDRRRSGLSAAELPAALMEDVLHALIVDLREDVALHAGAVAYGG